MESLWLMMLAELYIHIYVCYMHQKCQNATDSSYIYVTSCILITLIYKLCNQDTWYCNSMWGYYCNIFMICCLCSVLSLHRHVVYLTNKMFQPSNIHGLLLVLGLLVLSSPVFSVDRYQFSGCNGTFGRNKLYIQGFVPASGEVFTSETIVPAATLACQEVNNKSGVLDDYELVIEWSDTEVRNGGGTRKSTTWTCTYAILVPVRNPIPLNNILHWVKHVHNNVHNLCVRGVEAKKL